MKQTPETGLSKTPSVLDALPGFCRAEGRAREAEGATGASAGAVPLGNTGTTTVGGRYVRAYVKRNWFGSWSRLEVLL